MMQMRHCHEVCAGLSLRDDVKTANIMNVSYRHHLVAPSL